MHEEGFRRLRDAFSRGDHDEVENVWMELVEAPGVESADLRAFVEVGRGLVGARQTERAGALLELLLPALESLEPGSSEELIELHELLLRSVPGRPEFRDAYVEQFERRYGPATPERAFLDASGLREPGDLHEALDRLDRLRRLRAGGCVYHASGWGLGEILSIDPFLKQVKVDLENKKDHRISLGAVESILEVLDDDDFRALRYRKSDEIDRLAREDPAGLIDKVLEAVGNPLALKEIKACLVPDPIAAGSWSKWWNGAKQALREAGFYRVGERAPYRVEKLEERLDYEGDLIQRFRNGDWSERRRLARTALRAGEGKLVAARGEILRLLEETAGLAGAEGGPAGEALEAAVLRDSVGEGREWLDGVIDRLGTEATRTALETDLGGDAGRKVFTRLVEREPQEGDALLEWGIVGPSDAIRQTAHDALAQRSAERLATLGEKILRSPRLGPNGFCWMVERWLGGERDDPFCRALESRSEGEILALLIDLLEHLADRSARGRRAAIVRETLRRLEALLMREKGAFFRRGFSSFPAPRRVEVYRSVVAKADLLPRVGAKLLDLMAHVDPASAVTADEKSWWEGDAIWVTAEGLSRRREEFRTLMEEKIPANFEAVGKAADFGDLSENAEFTSALEEQALLTKRAERMKGELERARVLSAGDVGTDEVGPGSRIRVLDLDAAEESVFDILGPWDGQPEEGVLNYLSPLGAVFLGREPGEEFMAELPGGSRRYRLLEVGSWFESGAGVSRGVVPEAPASS